MNLLKRLALNILVVFMIAFTFTFTMGMFNISTSLAIAEKCPNGLHQCIKNGKPTCDCPPIGAEMPKIPSIIK